MIRKMLDLCNSYARHNFEEKEEIDVTYDNSYLVLGRDKYNNKLVGIDAKDAVRVLMLGQPGSGKTFSLRSFIDRAIQSGQHCIILNDVKDEFKSSIKPVQGKFRHLLLPNEKPKGFKVVTLRPTFFKKLLPEDMVDSEKDKYGLERYADNYWYSPDINDMRETEFMTLFNVETMTPIQQSVMEDFFEMLREKRKDNFDFQMFFDILENMDITEGTKQSLRNRLKPILRSYFYQEKWQRSVTHLLENGFVPALNFEQFDSFSNTGLAYPQAVMFMVMREVVEYMRRPKRKIKRLWGIIDEGARFFGNSELNKLSTYLSDSYELDRRYGVSYFFATQNYTTVPERIVKGSRYMLLPGRADVDTFKTVMRDFGCFRYQNQLTQEAKRLKDKVNANKHEWALFDRDGVGTDKVRVFVPLAPLSHHLETGK